MICSTITNRRILTRVGAPSAKRAAYTLIELLLVVAILGLAASMVIPAMGQTGVLRIQSAVRTLVADITFAQADALAFQSRRVIIFGRIAEWDTAGGVWQTVEGNGYTVFAPPLGAATVDLNNDLMFDPYQTNQPLSRDFGDERFAGAVITDPDFNGTAQLIYDELGGPVSSLTSDDPGLPGVVTIEGPNATYVVQIEGFTGRVTVTKTE